MHCYVPHTLQVTDECIYKAFQKGCGSVHDDRYCVHTKYIKDVSSYNNILQHFTYCVSIRFESA